MNYVLPEDPLGAFCRHTHAAASGAAAGPLHGLRFAAKDIYDVAGHRTGFGSPDWLKTHEPAARTATVVQQLLDAGATLVGRTQTDELTYSLAGENAHYGTPRNVNAPGRIPGGSSSGSAAAVAGELVDFALGSDTGGSVRAPASFCGIYGIRPTHGRVPLTGACPLASSFDTAGWFARDAALLARIGEVLLGGPARGEPKRLLYAEDAFALLMPEVAAALSPAVGAVESAFGTAERVTVSREGLAAWFDIFRTLQGLEVWAQHGEWVQKFKPDLGPGVRQRIEWASQLDPALGAAARAQREDVAQRMDALLANGAVLLLPTVPDIAPLLNASPKDTDDFRARAMSLLSIAGLARLPQVHLPLVRRDGCPVGVSLVGARGTDLMLLAAACRVGMPA